MIYLIQDNSEESLEKSFQEFNDDFEKFEVIEDRNTLFLEQIKDFYTVFNERRDITDVDKRVKINIALMKLREYKNSIKDVFDIQDKALFVDNKIDNYIESIQKKEKLCDLDVILFETSIQMHKEIFQNINNK